MSEGPLTEPTVRNPVLGNRYELRALVGRGGMGEVYEAVDRQLGRTVAVKVLRPELAADRGFAGRFRREARTAARLAHPGIVAVHDIGEDEGRVFIVMEFVAGRHLGRVIAEEAPADPARVARIGAEAAGALAHAHARGVVHRDIAPGNVMIAVDGRTRILDFGIARASRGSSARSGTDPAHGTLAYVAPERMRGEPADQRADIYALGAVLYELLTGHAPSRDAGPIAGPRSLRLEVPLPLDRIVMRCLAFNPSARYLRTGDLAAELRAMADVRVTEAPTAAGAEASEAGGARASADLLPGARTEVLTPAVPTRRLPHDGVPVTGELPAGRAVVVPDGEAGRRPRRRPRRLVGVVALGVAVLGAAWIALPSVASLAGRVTPTLHGPKPLHAPTGLTAATSCDGFLSARTELAWTPVAPSRGGYEVWRGEPGERGYRLVARIDDGRTTTYTDTGLAVDLTYRYVVRAADGPRVSAPSREVAAPTPLFCVV
jgi:eukaryotic-like serine/threonine-protein kinase